MKIDDICSPGMVPNAHRLRQETIRAIAFAETLQSSEKASDLIKYFYEAIAYLDREVLSKDSVESEKPHVDTSAVSPFDDADTEVLESNSVDELPDHIFPVKTPKETFVPINKRGKK